MVDMVGAARKVRRWDRLRSFGWRAFFRDAWPVGHADFEPSVHDESGAIAEFHGGSQQAMNDLYVDHFVTVDRAVGAFLQSVDKETVIHEVFHRVISDADLRASFQGGSLAAWMSTLARNSAIDHMRRSRPETAAEVCTELEGPQTVPSFETSVAARQLISRFRDQRLPEKWRGVFEMRFVRQLDQAEAARALGMGRTILLYREVRIRRLLHQFVLGDGVG